MELPRYIVAELISLGGSAIDIKNTDSVSGKESRGGQQTAFRNVMAANII